MADVITINSVDYPGYIEKEPDGYKGDPSKNGKYYKILKKDYNRIQKSSTIIYKMDSDLINSGVVLQYIEPNIFILKNYLNKYIWSINVENTDVYVKDHILEKKENKLKNNLFKLYNAGYIKILDEPEVEEKEEEINN